MEKISWTDRVRNEKSNKYSKGGKKIPQKQKKRKVGKL